MLDAMAKLGVPLFVLILSGFAAAATVEGPGTPVFYRDVLPVLQKRCQRCHRPGEIGPMPLETYAQVRPWAAAIREAVLRRKMPPWFADPRFGKFADDPTLTPAEIETIAKWAAGGAPKGDPAEDPKPIAWPVGWNIGKPDAVLEMPGTIPVPAKGVVEYQYVVMPTGFRRDRWVTEAEVRPTARRVVHHVVIYIRPPGSDWLKEAKPGIPYSIPEDDPRHRRLWTTSDMLLVYAPGNPPMKLPKGMAKKIPAGADLVFQMHYQPDGKAAFDHERIGLKFAKGPVEKRVFTLQLGNDTFVLPPEDPDVRVAAYGTLPRETEILSFFPHMHYRGASFAFHYIHPDGQIETMLYVKPYDFHWQLNYVLAKPRVLPKGAKLEWVAHFDNSKNNPNNPDPDTAVRFGEQSTAEMMIGFFDVTAPVGMDKAGFFVRK